MQDRSMISTVILSATLIALGFGYQGSANAQTCPGRALTALSDVTISSETLIPAAAGVPEYCDVKGFVTTDAANGNEDQFELALPDPPSGATGWNGKFLFLGNGGFAGSIQATVSSGLLAVSGEYATAATDAGHESPINSFGLGALDGSFALNNLQAQKDFFYNGVHVTAAATQILTGQYYGLAPRHRYFDGCSDGGHEAAVEAQVYPQDFDGIIEGDPAIEIGNILLGFNWNEEHALQTADSPLPASKVNNLLDPAITAECDALDGVKDGLIQDPRLCNFDPATLQCPASEPESTADADPACLSAGQVATLDAIYAGAQTTAGAQLYPGYTVSNPADGVPATGMPLWITGETAPAPGVSEPWGPVPAPPAFTSPITGLEFAPAQWSFMDQSLKYIAFSDPAYDSLTFDLNDSADVNTMLADADMNGSNGFNPNLEPFRHRGGKLLMYHGWSDSAITPLASIQYYNDVVQFEHGDLAGTRAFARLFMVPGMHHCGDGPGPNVFDTLTALDGWVASGVAPDGILALHYTNNDPAMAVDRTMPLCAYPEVAAFKGGNVNQARNWQCANQR